MNEKPEFETIPEGAISAKGTIHIVYDPTSEESHPRGPTTGWETMCGLLYKEGLPCVRERAEEFFASSAHLREFHNAYSKEDYCPKCIKGIPLAALARMAL